MTTFKRTYTFEAFFFMLWVIVMLLTHAEVSETLAEMQNSQSKLGKYEIEKMEQTLSLQQREAEISRLQEVIR